jgi:hypothetical protein
VRKRIETFLRTSIPLFFCLNSVEFNSVFVVHDVVESENSDAEGGVVRRSKKPFRVQEAPGDGTVEAMRMRRMSHLVVI